MRSSQNTKIQRNLAVSLALFWVVVAITLSFYVYKPFSPAFAAAVGGAALDIAVMVVFTCVAGGLGRWMLSFMPLDDWNRAEHIAATALLGYACLALPVLLVGVLALNALTMIGVLLVIAVLVRQHVVQWIAESLGWLRTKPATPLSLWDTIEARIVVLAVILALGISLLPPTKWDVLTYHLAGPQQYVEHGRFYAAAHNHFLGFPQQVDVLYAAQLALTGRLTGSSLLHWAMGSFMLLLVGGMATRRFGLRGGLVAVSALIAGKSIWLEMTFAYADLLPMGLAALGLNVADAWSNARSQARPDNRLDLKYVSLMGMIGGLAMGTKYTTLWLGAALGALVLWIVWRDSWRNRLTCAAIYGVVALIMLSPWLVRNLLWYENPVYPFFLSTSEMDSIRQDWYRNPGSGMIHTADAWQVPILPVAATVLGVEGGEGFGTSIGALYLMLCPLLVLVWSKITNQEKRFAGFALVMGGVITLCWMYAAGIVSYANQSTRLVLYMFPPLALAAGLVMEALGRLVKKPFDLAFVVHAMIAMLLIFAGIDYTQDFISSGFATYFSGGDGYRDAFLEQKLGWHYEAMRQVNALPPDSTVRFLWEPRYLYCDEEVINCYTDSLMDGWYYARRTIDSGTPADIAHAWQEAGFDYLLVYEFGRNFEKDANEFYTPEDWALWENFTTQFLDEVWAGGNRSDELQYIIYQWKNNS